MPRKTFNGIIPTAHYRCEGADLGSGVTDHIHFRDPDGGFLTPDQLFLITVIDRKYDSECTGFFCTSCIEASKLKTSGKLTLKEAISSRFQQAHQKASRELLQATGS